MMKREEVLTALCEICCSVMASKFQYSEAADCFCGSKDDAFYSRFQFSEKVIEFIREAVKEKLQRETNLKF